MSVDTEEGELNLRMSNETNALISLQAQGEADCSLETALAAPISTQPSPHFNDLRELDLH